MSFLDKNDYYGIGSTYSSSLTIKSGNENKSASVFEAKDAKGDVVAREVYGEKAAPTNAFEVVGDIEIALNLGTVNEFGTSPNARKFCLGSMSIKTSLGQPATVDVSGEQVEFGATTANSSTVAFGYLKLSRFHDAQIPAFRAGSTGEFTPAFSLGTGEGTDFFLNDTQIDLAVDISKATVNGVCVKHDVQNGRCAVQVTIVQIDDTHAPSITPASGWDMTSPLTVDSQDEGQPTWKCTLTKSFLSTHPAS